MPSIITRGAAALPVVSPLLIININTVTTNLLINNAYLTTNGYKQGYRVQINVNTDVISASTSTPAVVINVSIVGIKLLVIFNSGGAIYGKGGIGGSTGGGSSPSGGNGGAGGAALQAISRVSIINRTSLFGGGGGGGGAIFNMGKGGDGAGNLSVYNNGAAGYFANIGAGVATAGQNGSTTYGGFQGQGGAAYDAGGNYRMAGCGGGGGFGSSGGNGGTYPSYNPTPATGGAGGAAVIGNTNITWIVTGNRYGVIT